MAEKPTGRFVLVCVVMLVVFGTAPGTAEIAEKETPIQGIERLRGPDSAKKLLRKNGFVVVPRFYRQIFSPYVQESLPPFVTTDSLHRTFHVIFEEQIKTVEKQFTDDLHAVSTAMLDALQDRLESGDLNERQRRTTRIAVEYFQVGKALLQGRTARELRESGDVSDTVVREVELILAEQGKARSPLFDYPDSPFFPYRIDYSRFRPRGFYTDTPALRRYFRAMTWYGNCAFRLVSDRETRVAILITRTLQRHPEALKRWKKMDRIYDYLVAEPDDLTPLQYADLLSGMNGGGAENGLERFRELAEDLPDPGVNSMVIPPRLMPRWRELSKGMRFFGKRYVPDAEVFMHLTYPEVPKRWFPSGLDVMAVMGSKRARTLQEKAGATDKQGYEQGFEESRAVIRRAFERENPSHYVRTMKLTQTLLDGPDSDDLPFMRTSAYRDKNLMTALAAWMLHAKQSVTYGGFAQTPPTGRVEPNFEFYRRLHELIRHTLQVLETIEGIERQRLRELDELVQEVEAIGRRQVRGEPLTDEQKYVLQDYGWEIARLAYFEKSSAMAERNLPWMGLVADVFTEHLKSKCLEEAVGAALPMYVVVPQDGKRWLMVGGVYSYYEFKRPISRRLTDEEWRHILEVGQVPPMPGWTSSFVAGFDVGSLVRRIRKGVPVPEATYVNARELVDFLEKATEPGGALEGKGNLDWAVRLYGMKAGRDAVPTLLEYLREAERASEEERLRPDPRTPYDLVRFQRLSPRARGAAAALLHVARAEDLPALKEMALGHAGRRATPAIEIIGSIRAKAAEKVLLDLLKNGPRGSRGLVKRLLFDHGSRDVTPHLLELFPEMRPFDKGRLLEGLARVWGNGLGYPELWRWPDTMDEERAGELRRRVESLVRETLHTAEDESLLSAARRAAKALGIEAGESSDL